MNEVNREAKDTLEFRLEAMPGPDNRYQMRSIALPRPVQTAGVMA